MEYIYFFHGISLLLLAAVCFFLRKKRYAAPAWAWLGAFGLMHWFYTWLEILAFQFPDWQAFSALRTAIMTLSFIFLLEFGRRTLRNSGAKTPALLIYTPLLLLIYLGWTYSFATAVVALLFAVLSESCRRLLKRHGAKTPALLIYTPLLLAAPFGLVYDLNALNTSIRYILGFTAGLLAAWALYRGLYKTEAPLHQPLIVMSIGLFLYALTAGCVTPASQIAPARWLNYDSFSRIFGFPVELLRALAATAITLCAYVYMQRLSRAKAVTNKSAANKRRCRVTRRTAGAL
ncbi:MAG TPA: hypothetical protein DCZ92_06775 [Elusimicrobia bacterium]|nr:MAG: hypothetical protein A2016_05190 [Elusimicrobia bacterium GWF2_62_30]HBA60509.1 hypothetical protein [Elusimicrobiota bacterium]